MSQATLAEPQASYDDADFAALAAEVANLAHIVGVLIESAKRQSDLIGMLLDMNGMSR